MSAFCLRLNESLPSLLHHIATAQLILSGLTATDVFNSISAGAEVISPSLLLSTPLPDLKVPTRSEFLYHYMAAEFNKTCGLLIELPYHSFHQLDRTATIDLVRSLRNRKQIPQVLLRHQGIGEILESQQNTRFDLYPEYGLPLNVCGRFHQGIELNRWVGSLLNWGAPKSVYKKWMCAPITTQQISSSRRRRFLSFLLHRFDDCLNLSHFEISHNALRLIWFSFSSALMPAHNNYRIFSVTLGTELTKLRLKYAPQFIDGLFVSNTSKFKPFLLIMYIDAPESTTNPLSSYLILDGEGHTTFLQVRRM